jgi:hypothetical protein
MFIMPELPLPRDAATLSVNDQRACRISARRPTPLPSPRSTKL